MPRKWLFPNFQIIMTNTESLLKMIEDQQRQINELKNLMINKKVRMFYLILTDKPTDSNSKWLCATLNVRILRDKAIENKFMQPTVAINNFSRKVCILLVLINKWTFNISTQSFKPTNKIAWFKNFGNQCNKQSNVPALAVKKGLKKLI